MKESFVNMPCRGKKLSRSRDQNVFYFYELPMLKFSKKMRFSLVLLLLMALLSACGGEGRIGANAPLLLEFAGSLGGEGNLDGFGGAARFRAPTGIAMDAAGNTYVADAASHTIRKISSGGVVTTFAGSDGIKGSADGAAKNARFDSPNGIAIDISGVIYVADTGNHVIRKILSDGSVSTYAGLRGVTGADDGFGEIARFNAPTQITADQVGNLFVADTNNNIIRKIESNGRVSTLAGSWFESGSVDGAALSARFNQPQGVGTDRIGNVYVADTGNFTIRKITAEGFVSTIAGVAGSSGATNGFGVQARFQSPIAVTADQLGNLFVSDLDQIRKISAIGQVDTFAGAPDAFGSVDEVGEGARFSAPSGLVFDTLGNLYVADSLNSSIRKLNSLGLASTFAGAPALEGIADGVASKARFKQLQGLASDTFGNLYTTDKQARTIRKITSAAVVTTVAGTPNVSGGFDGIGGAANFNLLDGVAVDSLGNLFVVDTGNNTVRKISATGEITTLAGAAYVSGNQDGSDALARFNAPRGIVVDPLGNLFVTDSLNNTVRKINPLGVVSTFVGVVGALDVVDGAAGNAKFALPGGIVIDPQGNFYVTDSSTIRKITPSGNVTTFAGSSTEKGHVDGTGSAARFAFPSALAIDNKGNLYVADEAYPTVRKITPNGTVTTLVGQLGQIGFASGGLPGSLPIPSGLAVRGNSLYIATKNGIAVVNNLP